MCWCPQVEVLNWMTSASPFSTMARCTCMPISLSSADAKARQDTIDLQKRWSVEVIQASKCEDERHGMGKSAESSRSVGRRNASLISSDHQKQKKLIVFDEIIELSSKILIHAKYGHDVDWRMHRCYIRILMKNEDGLIGEYNTVAMERRYLCK